MDRVLKEKTLVPRLTENFKNHVFIATKFLKLIWGKKGKIEIPHKIEKNIYSLKPPTLRFISWVSSEAMSISDQA